MPPGRSLILASRPGPIGDTIDSMRRLALPHKPVLISSEFPTESLVMRKSAAHRITLTAFVTFTIALAAASQAAEKVDPSGTWKWKRELEGTNSESVLKLKV